MQEKKKESIPRLHFSREFYSSPPSKKGARFPRQCIVGAGFRFDDDEAKRGSGSEREAAGRENGPRFIHDAPDTAAILYRLQCIDRLRQQPTFYVVSE